MATLALLRHRPPDARKAASLLASGTSLHPCKCLSTDAPDEATAVVIGGGVVGCSIAYHLSKGGLKNVVLLERRELAASSWHKPGLISYFHPATRFKRLCEYSIDLYAQLAEETGDKVFFRRPGTIRLATTPKRVDEAMYFVARDWSSPRKFKFLPPDEVAKRHPLVDSNKILGGLLTEGDGFVDTGKISALLAASAKKYGARLVEHTSVLNTKLRSDGYWDIETDKGTIKSMHLINSAGLWARDIARMVNANMPLVCVKHEYAMTKDLAELSNRNDPLPVLHDPEGRYYCRQEKSGLLFGAIEEASKVHLLKDWYTHGIPSDLKKEPLNEDFSQLQEQYRAASDVLPALQKAEIANTFARVLCMSPDGLPLLGPIDECSNYWLAGGFSDGVAVGGGIGMYLARWLIDGEPPFELTSLEPNRYHNWAFKHRNYIFDKTAETYALSYANVLHKPDRPAGRPTDRISGIYGALKQQGAQMSFRCGWEQCYWFKLPGVNSYREAINRECELVMTKAGVIDLSLYGKIEVKGPDATKFIDAVSTCKAPEEGSMKLAYMLTPRGKILSRMRISRHKRKASEYLVLVRPEQEQRDKRWMELIARQQKYNVAFDIVTEYLACIGVVGPLSRQVMQDLTKENMKDDNFPPLASRMVRLAGLPVIVSRDPTAGETGYLLYHMRADSLKLYEALMRIGQPYGIGNFGRWAFNSLRIEKGAKLWGYELTLDYDPVEAAVEAEIDESKGDFVGMAAFKELKSKQPERRLRLLQLDDGAKPLVTDPEGMEAVWQGDQIVGHVTSGCYSRTLQAPLCFAYISTKLPNNEPLEVEIIGQKVTAKVLERAPKMHS